MEYSLRIQLVETMRLIFQVLVIWLNLIGFATNAISQLTSDNAEASDLFDETVAVGRFGGHNAATPVNQILTPYGRQIDLPGMRPQAIALSPDKRRLAVSGKTNKLIIIEIANDMIEQEVSMPNTVIGEVETDPDQPNIDGKAQVSFTGLIYSPVGDKIFLSDVNGSIKVFQVRPDGIVEPAYSFALPPANAPRRSAEIPSGLALNSDATRLYVCGNLSNQLLELDTKSGAVLRQWQVGVAPYDVVIVGEKAYVSNWGGRRPKEEELTGPAGRGTVVKVDPVRHIASEGSVSIIDFESKTTTTSIELVTGLHASDLALSPDGSYIVCANAASDTLSVIDVATDRVIQTITVKPKPSDLFGASPNALVFGPDDETLYVANGSQNAVAVIEFEPKERSMLRGLIPVGWYPGALCFDSDSKRLHVANIKGLPLDKKVEPGTGVESFNSHHYSGSLSTFVVPADSTLDQLSERVARNLRAERISQSALKPRSGQPPKAIPNRIGEPSFIKHVVYVIKENRTYDQVLGDIDRGNGNAELCIFGREITPNQHKLVDEFVLLDNTYCAGILSADGHQWSTTAISTDYMEKSFAGFPRSYPDGMGVDEDDALAYSPAGFIWDNAIAHNISIRNYGEFMMPKVRYRDSTKSSSPDYLACYRTWMKESDEVVFECDVSVESLRSFSPTGYVGWQMSVPDQFRADFILNELRQFEAEDNFPQLTIICLPNDHASGTSPGCPTPASCLADNDLAFGRIVEALSHSKFWPAMAIMAIEDDPQAGWDHVSGYRTTAYCISPYAKRGAVVSTQYNTTSILRTIEQILGLPPMNQFDASAVPMFDCFQEQADFTPFNALPTNVPLDQMNPQIAQIEDEQAAADAIASSQMNFREVDRAPEDQLNRILWRAMKGIHTAYPTWAVALDIEDDDD